jgi:hypothetical protein
MEVARARRFKLFGFSKEAIRVIQKRRRFDPQLRNRATAGFHNYRSSGTPNKVIDRI